MGVGPQKQPAPLIWQGQLGQTQQATTGQQSGPAVRPHIAIPTAQVLNHPGMRKLRQLEAKISKPPGRRTENVHLNPGKTAPIMIALGGQQMLDALGANAAVKIPR